MAILWLNGHCPPIPELDGAELASRRLNLKPVVRIDNVLGYIEPIDTTCGTLTFGVKPSKALGCWTEVARIETHHECGHISLFKPSIDEVLRQVPQHIAEEADCFEVLTGDTVACYSEGDGHRTVTVFYRDLSDEDDVKKVLKVMGWSVIGHNPLIMKHQDGRSAFHGEANAIWREARETVAEQLKVVDLANE